MNYEELVRSLRVSASREDHLEAATAIEELQAKVRELEDGIKTIGLQNAIAYQRLLDENDALKRTEVIDLIQANDELVTERDTLLQQLEAEKLETERLTDLLCEANKDEGDGVVYALRQQLEAVSKDAEQLKQALRIVNDGCEDQRVAMIELAKERDTLRQQLEAVTALLIECRSSVKLDLDNYERFILRKGAAVNDCDTDEVNRIAALLDYIDGLEH